MDLSQMQGYRVIGISADAAVLAAMINHVTRDYLFGLNLPRTRYWKHAGKIEGGPGWFFTLAPIESETVKLRSRGRGLDIARYLVARVPATSYPEYHTHEQRRGWKIGHWFMEGADMIVALPTWV